MTSLDEQILRASKEIVVKFIETGRVSPASFRDIFLNIHNTVSDAAKGVSTTNVLDSSDKK